jgi:hypothetical protein
MLVYLAANRIPLGLRVTGQEVPPKLICLGNCLGTSLLGFLEHLLGLLDLHLVGLHVNIQQDGDLGPSSLLEILQCPKQPHYSLAQLPALCDRALLLDDT